MVFIKIAVIDDMAADRNSLISVLIPYLNECDSSAEIQEFVDGEHFLEAFQPEMFDVCFLDIYMKSGGKNGMEIAQVIADADPECHIVFLTVSNDFLAAGYSVRAWRYLEKPLTPQICENEIVPLFNSS